MNEPIVSPLFIYLLGVVEGIGIISGIARYNFWRDVPRLQDSSLEQPDRVRRQGQGLPKVPFHIPQDASSILDLLVRLSVRPLKNYTTANVCSELHNVRAR